ncbi:AAA domain-containing protein [Paenibacillus rhizoplanae]|uniref:AAA domain-containing protein n=1 Tax=Paenibacillus rhizoplanae TaxID=1917181 RepID=UPI00361B208F
MAAKNEMSFVLQGPPGTGKSQTISNIIAENLANNKKVLFVSEKMAALNVVKNRLESEGLGDFCIEMHSQKANKRQVLDEINHVLNVQGSNKKISKEVYGQINIIREKLNTYSEKVHLTREPYDMTVYEIHGILSRLQTVPEFTVDFNISPTTELESIYRLLADLERYRASVYKSDFHPWEGYNDESFSLEIKSKVKTFLER